MEFFLNGVFAVAVVLGLVFAGMTAGKTEDQRFWLIASAAFFLLYAITDMLISAG